MLIVVAFSSQKLAAQVEQKKLTGSGDTGEGKKKKGKKGKKILIKETGGASDQPAAELAPTSVAVPCNVCGKEVRARASRSDELRKCVHSPVHCQYFRA